jgi:hypothetical protein
VLVLALSPRTPPIAVAAGGNFQLTYSYGDTVAIFKLYSATVASLKATVDLRQRN